MIEGVVIPGIGWGQDCVIGGENEKSWWEKILDLAVGYLPGQTTETTQNKPPSETTPIETTKKETFWDKKINIMGQDIPLWIILAIAFYLFFVKK